MNAKTLSLWAPLAIIMLASAVYASGVAMPYWDTNPLQMTKGESKIIQIELQNLVGDNDINFKVTLTSTNDVARLVESQDTYLIKAGERRSLPIQITVPSDAPLGTKYRVTVTAQEAKTSTPGQFSLGSAFENSFDVVIGEPKTQSNAGILSFVQSNTLILIIVAVIVVLAIIVMRRRRNAQ